MQPGDVPEPLSLRLGTEATAALAELLDRAYQEQRTDMIAACSERFERRLLHETGSIRTLLAQVQADLRLDMIKGEARLRQDMTRMETSLRQDMTKMETTLRQDLATGRVELFKWSFLFWIGQVVAVSAIIGVMLRLYRP